MSDYDRFCDHGVYLGRNCEACEQKHENALDNYRTSEARRFAGEEIDRITADNARLRAVYDAAKKLLDQHDNMDDCTDGFEGLDEAIAAAQEPKQ